MVGPIILPSNYPGIKNILKIYTQTFQSGLRTLYTPDAEGRYRALLSACEAFPSICGPTLVDALTKAGPNGTAITQQEYAAYQKSGQSIAAWMQSHGSQLLLQNVMSISAAVGGVAAMKSALREIVGGYDEPTEWHHVLPQQFRKFFERAGVNIDEATVELPQSIHQAAHDEGWNAEWQKFINLYPNATEDEITAYAGRMMWAFGLDEYAMGVGPYPR